MMNYELDDRDIIQLAKFVVPHCIVLFFCVIMMVVQAVTPYIDSFGVDSEGRIYVCEKDGISIYKDGEKVSSFSVIGDSYGVCIDEHDRIGVVYSSSVEWLDDNGNVIEIYKDSDFDPYEQPNGVRKVVTVDGDKYVRCGQLFWTVIVKNNTEIVYHQSIWTFLFKLLFQLCVVSWCVNGMRTIIRIIAAKTANESDS